MVAFELYLEVNRGGKKGEKKRAKKGIFFFFFGPPSNPGILESMSLPHLQQAYS